GGRGKTPGRLWLSCHPTNRGYVSLRPLVSLTGTRPRARKNIEEFPTRVDLNAEAWLLSPRPTPAEGIQLETRPAMAFSREGDLRLSIRMGLTKGLRLVRGMRRQLDEDERTRRR